jgi:SAM-dependent methyltransferase
MWLLWTFLVVFIASFSLVLLRGAPYLPTLQPQVETALDMLDLKKGDTLLELGCGDGRVLVAAAKRGWKVVGYELNPLLAGLAWLRTRRYGRTVMVVWGDYWQASWPEAQGIFAFLLPRYMKKLDKKIIQQINQPVKLVSFAFRIPDKSATRQHRGIFLYHYKQSQHRYS